MKILAVDDHPLIQEALGHVLRKLDASVQLVRAFSVATALNAAPAHPDVDLILLDFGLPDSDGLSALAQMREQWPTVPVVVVSATDHPDVVLKAIDAGAMGFIPKTCGNEVLVEALRLVLAGGVYLPREVLKHGLPPSAAEVLPESARTAAPPMKALSEYGLTRRQADVLSLLVKGLPNKVICRELSLAEGTVKLHITAILRALNARNRTQAVIAVAREGIQLERLDRAPSDLDRER